MSSVTFASGYGCVIHFDGATPYNGFPTSGQGRAVMFSFVAHWSGQSGADLADPNVQKLFVNAVSWACK